MGNIIESNHQNINQKYYGPIDVHARHLLGYSHLALTSRTLVPSVLEHYETSLRDPVIYQWMKKIVNWSQRYVKTLTPYTEEQLNLQGVEITTVKIDPLITYMDYFDSDLTNAVNYNENEPHNLFKLRVRQLRINHKPFTYKLYVKSDKTQKVSVKLFLGPKIDEYDRPINLTHNRLNFVFMDHVEFDLRAGINVITRSSHDFTNYVPDQVSNTKILSMYESAWNGTDEFNIPQQNSIYWPRR